jgi:arginine N-succinyltransferase
MTAPLYVVRALGERDLKALGALRALAGPGFSSLAVSDAILEERVALSAASFAASPSNPGKERYFLALEHVETGALVGLAGIKALVGEKPPFFNFRVLQIAQASAAADRRFDMEVLILVNEFTACSEVGSLFVHPDHRAGGVGRMVAQSRYMLMASDPQRFSQIVVSELRGVVDESGHSPFWEHLGRHFFRMTFNEADKLSATTDNQFILDLMPKYPIYVDLLPPEARAVIGKTHPLGAGALKLLEWEGFRYDRVVDIFEGGPLVSCARDTIRTFRETRRLACRIGETRRGRTALVANAATAHFRLACVQADIDADVVTIDEAGARALRVNTGDAVLAWSNDAH